MYGLYSLRDRDFNVAYPTPWPKSILQNSILLEGRLDFLQLLQGNLLDMAKGRRLLWPICKIERSKYKIKPK